MEQVLCHFGIVLMYHPVAMFTLIPLELHHTVDLLCNGTTYHIRMLNLVPQLFKLFSMKTHSTLILFMTMFTLAIINMIMVTAQQLGSIRMAAMRCNTPTAPLQFSLVQIQYPPSVLAH